MPGKIKTTVNPIKSLTPDLYRKHLKELSNSKKKMFFLSKRNL